MKLIDKLQIIYEIKGVKIITFHFIFINIISILICLTLVLTKYNFNPISLRNLSECGIESSGTFLNIEKNTTSSIAGNHIFNINYEYKINNKKYTDNISTLNLKFLEFKKKGDTIKIIYNKNNFYESTIKNIEIINLPLLFLKGLVAYNIILLIIYLFFITNGFKRINLYKTGIIVNAKIDGIDPLNIVSSFKNNRNPLKDTLFPKYRLKYHYYNSQNKKCSVSIIINAKEKHNFNDEFEILISASDENENIIFNKDLLNKCRQQIS